MIETLLNFTPDPGTFAWSVIIALAAIGLLALLVFVVLPCALRVFDRWLIARYDRMVDAEVRRRERDAAHDEYNALTHNPPIMVRRAA